MDFNPEQPVNFWEEQRDYKIHKILEQGLNDTIRREEVDPQELERRIKILKDYLQLSIEVQKKKWDVERQKIRSLRQEYEEDPWEKLTTGIKRFAYELGLTEKEIFELSDDPDWQYYSANLR